MTKQLTDESEFDRSLLTQTSSIDAKDLYLIFDKDLETSVSKYAKKRFEVSGMASKVGSDLVRGKPSIELSDKTGGKCYVLCLFNSDDIYNKVSVGDNVICRGDYHIASGLFGIVLKNTEIVEIKSISRPIQ